MLDELFGIVNVPNGVWIDEAGTIVRPAEPAQPGRNPVTDSFRTMDLSTLEPEIAKVLRRGAQDPHRSRGVRRDAPGLGRARLGQPVRASALTRSSAARDPRGLEAATAAAHFELGQHLHRNGDHDAAVPHWREAHRLDPDNWTYRRNAWNFEDPVRQGHTAVVRQLLVRGRRQDRRRELLPATPAVSGPSDSRGPVELRV